MTEHTQAQASEREALRIAIDALAILSRRPRPMCRDCADENGTCPGTGLPCDIPAVIANARAALASRFKEPGGEAPRALPETMDRDEMLKYYSSYANLCAHESLQYQKRIRELQAALASTPPPISASKEALAAALRKVAKWDDEHFGELPSELRAVVDDALASTTQPPATKGVES